MSVLPLVSQLVQLPFFRYFKVNIYCDCPLWPDDSMCMMRACSVCECDDGEVPKPWLAAEQRVPCNAAAQKEAGGCDDTKCAAELDATVDRGLDPGMQQQLLQLKGWRGYNNPWMAEGDEDEEYLYINLLSNPERYTGYQGEHAHRIWSGVYSQGCLQQLDSVEQRILHRLLSGMHASISMHLSAKWLVDEAAGVWGPNLTEFERRLGTPDVKDRVENLYFSFLFVLRAVLKAAPLLERFDYSVGDPGHDSAAGELVRALVRLPGGLPAACPMPFDEARLWRGEEGEAIKAQLQAAFRNITTLMDCVGCEKCKLWGKLQTLGIATALKVLHSSQDALHLERNEVIALINTLERLASSIAYYRDLSTQLAAQQPAWARD
ncbi:hypothetical protein FOA52_000054 [Chlamydomonas sp. UWO 241]|nr:hypothetical protein FOA52_000054 [Chlamydomonas sp. UWO 241]